MCRLATVALGRGPNANSEDDTPERGVPGCLARPPREHQAFIASRSPPALRSVRLREVFRESVPGARQGLLRDTRLLKCR